MRNGVSWCLKLLQLHCDGRNSQGWTQVFTPQRLGPKLLVSFRVSLKHPEKKRLGQLKRGQHMQGHDRLFSVRTRHVWWIIIRFLKVLASITLVARRRYKYTAIGCMRASIGKEVEISQSCRIFPYLDLFLCQGVISSILYVILSTLPPSRFCEDMLTACQRGTISP